MKISDKQNKFALKAINSKTNLYSKQITLAIASVICLAINYLLVWIAKNNQEFIETYYSRGFYKEWSQLLTAINKWFSFSLSEVTYIIMIVIIIGLLLIMIKELISKDFKKALTKLLIIVLVLSANVLYYQASWGLNNYRNDIETLFELSDRDIGLEELSKSYEYLVLQSNKYKSLSNIEMIPTKTEVLKNVYKGYENLSLKYEFIDGSVSVAKPLLISPLFSMSSYTGIYLPLFSEANINDMPHISGIGFTASHELAHQKGFASEDEANFLGFLSGANHEEAYYKYSAYQAMMIYVGNSLYKNDKDIYTEISALRSDLVIKDLIAKRDFWDIHVNERTSEVHNQVNDAFLKANNQPDGIINYSKVTELFIKAYLDGLFEEYQEL